MWFDDGARAFVEPGRVAAQCPDGWEEELQRACGFLAAGRAVQGVLRFVWRHKEGRKEIFYLTTHSTHFIYGYMASDIG